MQHSSAGVQLALGICLIPLAAGADTTPTQALYTDQKIESVVVHARRIKDQLEAEKALTPGGVTVIDAEEIRERNVGNLADMLRYVPGLWSDSSSGTDNIFFSSRGSNLDATDYDMNGIKLLQDGLSITTADGNNHNRIVDPLSARYATVARGANALTYGASTLGGAINFISQTARNSPPRELYLSGGSHGELIARATVGGVVDDRYDGLITVESKHWQGYRAHNEQDRRGVYANAGWQLSDAVETRWFLTYVHNDQELPGTLSEAQLSQDRDQASPQAIGGNYQLNVETSRAANKTTWIIDENSSLETGFSYEQQRLYHPIVDKVLVDFDGPGPALPTEVFSLLVNTELRNISGMLRYNLRAGDHNILAGLNYGNSHVDGGNYRNDAGRRNGLTTDIRDRSGNLETFVVDRWQLADRWNLLYSAQVISTSRNVREITVADGAARNPKRDYSSINPRAGLTYALSDNISVFANISRLYEAPTIFELQDDARGDDRALDAMQGTVFEIGTRGSQELGVASHWHWDMTYYHAQIRDEILSVDDTDAPGTSLSANIGETTHAGLEALLGASFAIDDNGAQRIEPLISATVNRFFFKNDPDYGNNRLPAAPIYAVRGEVMYRHANGFYAGPTFDLIGNRYADFSNTYVVDGYTLLGLRAGFDAKTWKVFAELKNLTDRKTISTFSVLDKANPDSAILNPGAPRSFYVGAQLQF